MDEEARLSRAAWAQSMDTCNQTRSEGISLRTTVMAQQSEITELQAADRRRQAVITDLLKTDYRRQRQLVEALKIVKSLQDTMAELIKRQQGPATDPAAQKKGTKRKAHEDKSRVQNEWISYDQELKRMETGFRQSNMQPRRIREVCHLYTYGNASTMVELTARTMTNDVAYADDVNCGTKIQEAPKMVSLQPTFQELGIADDRMFPEETDKIERYSTVDAEPDFTQVIDDTKTRGSIEDSSSTNKQQPNKRQNTSRLMQPGNGDKKPNEMGLNLDVPSVTSTIMVLVHQHAPTARSLAPGQGLPLQEQLPLVEEQESGKCGNGFCQGALCSGVGRQNPSNNVVTRQLERKSLEPRTMGTQSLNSKDWLPMLKGVFAERKCRSPVCWAEVGEVQLTVPEIVQEDAGNSFKLTKDSKPLGYEVKELR
ncbi:hypothetical protein Tco_0149042 [Tanacetum coccineum]